MKKRILLFTAVAGMATFMLTSGDDGAGHGKGYNCTGSETLLANTNGCKASGCHGTTVTTDIGITLELDSAGVATTHYTPGMSYTVKISGVNNTINNLPRFGFQLSCIKGAVAVGTPVNAGAFAQTGLPASVRYTAAIPTNFVCNMIEHSAPIPATTGTGAAGTTYVESIPWTAPAAGTGTISFWGAMLGSNFNTDEHGDFWNTTNLVISERGGTNAVAAITADMSITAYPNPATTHLNVQVDHAQAGNYSLQVFDAAGRTVAQQQLTLNGKSTTAIGTANWAAGTYHVVLQGAGTNKTMTVMKN